MEREACVCDHGFERSDLCAEIIIIIIIIRQGKDKNRMKRNTKKKSNTFPHYRSQQVSLLGLDLVSIMQRY